MSIGPAQNAQAHRASIFMEDARILDHQPHPGGQYILRLHAPKCAARAQPGQFVHLQCDPELAMRRPFSIMRASAVQGWIDIFYKLLGQGTRLLARRTTGETLSVMGPIGEPFKPHRPRPLLLGGGVGIPPMIFLADRLRLNKGVRPLAMLGSELPFPFRPRPSKIMVPGMPEGVIAAMPLLDDWGIPSRLTSQQGFAGCFDGLITDLATLWLEAASAEERAKVELFACGPPGMLKAVADVAGKYRLPCQVSLEEYMACAVGGCAGCAVEVQTGQGPAMKRVCVDGPVFDAQAVFPDELPARR
ncbi:MAG: dihydroorotate dehydrogenase electron transfer subunit [Gammaproteobacteria bacterium]